MFRNSQTLFDWNGFFTAAFTAGIEGRRESSNAKLIWYRKFQIRLLGKTITSRIMELTYVELAGLESH